MIVVKCEKLYAEINENNGGNIIQLKYDDLKFLDKQGIRAWIKTGKKKDPATGVLGNFLGDLRDRSFDVVEQSECFVILSARINDIVVVKRIELIGHGLLLRVDVHNKSKFQTPRLQIEFFNMFSGGRLKQRDGKFTAIVDGKGDIVDILFLENFGQRYVKAYEYENSMIILGDTNNDKWIKITADSNAETVTCMVQGNVFTRGFNSRKFSLQPNEQFSFSQKITIETESLYGIWPALKNKVKANKSDFSAKSSKKSSLEKNLHGEPVFLDRWSHLCLQYDYVDTENIKKLLDELFVPLRYTGIVFELNRGVRTKSHPELAESWAMPIEKVKTLINYARFNGLQIGIEFNSPGHQNETGIEKVYPELLETGRDRASTICVSNEQARSIIRDVLIELTETLEPDIVHLGADEGQYEGRETSFGCCDICCKTGKKPYELFGEYLQWIATLFKEIPVVLAIWSDMFIRSEQFGPLVSGNGSAGEIYKALDYLDRRVKIFDWHYFPADEYKSLDFFGKQGFEVWPATAFHFEGIRKFLGYAEHLNIKKAIHTTWSVPNQEKFTIESSIWAGFYHWYGRQADLLDIHKIAYEFSRHFW